jgi:PIN domain nuclease of toxin-antitoxin system
MKLLLDTHALYWWMIEEKRLSLTARKALQARASQIYVSPASAYELAYKHREGLLPKAGPLVRNFDAEIAEEGFFPLPITMEHGHRAGELADEHGDPFDRLLAAQAIVENMAIVSNDEKLSALGAKRVW